MMSLSSNALDKNSTTGPAPGKCPRGVLGIFGRELTPPLLLCAILLSHCILRSSQHYYWLDEVYTHYQASDPSFSHMMGAMSDLINTTPPLYFILTWCWAQCFGCSELALRVFTSLGYCVGGIALWSMLRRTFGWWPAVLGLFLVLLGSEDLIYHNGEARFYGLLFAETMLAVLLFAVMSDRKKAGIGLLTLNAAVHAALVTTHYLGFFYGIAFLLATCSTQWRDVRQMSLRCGSILIGWLAFLPCIPAFLHHMKLGKPHTWIETPTLPKLLDVYDIAGNGLVELLFLSAAAFTIFQLVRRNKSASPRDNIASKRLPPPAASSLILAGWLFFVPVTLWLYSVLLTPAFMPRYVMPPVLAGWAIVLAFTVQRLSELPAFEKTTARLHRMAPTMIWQSLMLLIVGLTVAYASKGRLGDFLSGQQTTLRFQQQNTLKLLDTLPRNVPIVFCDIHKFLPMAYHSKRQDFALLIDKDWAFSYKENAKPAIPRGAANDTQIAEALRRQYDARVYDAEDFIPKVNRAIIICPESHMSLLDKWVKKESFSTRVLFKEWTMSFVLVERKNAAGAARAGKSP